MRWFGIYLGALLATGAAAADERGIWTKAGPHARENIFCLQVWSCNPPYDVLHDADTKIVVTPPESTHGSCATDGSSLNACSVCAAVEPEVECRWSVEPK